MEISPLKLAAAAAVAAAIGFGGVSLAAAQEDPTTGDPSAEVGATEDENCPHGDGPADTTVA